MPQDKDRGSKFLLAHDPGVMLKLANITGFTNCRSVQSESVAPRQLPDGLLEVTFPVRAEPDLFLIEIETYPARDSAEQMAADIAVVELVRGVVPDAILFVLHPKGKANASRNCVRTSRHQTVENATKWRVIELWTLNAYDLFAMNEIGVIPWVPLTHFDGSPEELVSQCRERIDRQALPRDHDALLVVTQIMTNLAFPNNKALLDLLIGDRSMIRIESPLIAEWEDLFEKRGEARGLQRGEQLGLQRGEQLGLQRGLLKAILTVLRTRFGAVPDEVAVLVHAANPEDLDSLNEFAVRCADMNAFRERLANSPPSNGD